VKGKNTKELKEGKKNEALTLWKSFSLRCRRIKCGGSLFSGGACMAGVSCLASCVQSAPAPWRCLWLV